MGFDEISDLLDGTEIDRISDVFKFLPSAFEAFTITLSNEEWPELSGDLVCRHILSQFIDSTQNRDFVLCLCYQIGVQSSWSVAVIRLRLHHGDHPGNVLEDAKSASLQWWRDAIEEAFGGSPTKDHPLLRAYEKISH